MTTAATYRIIHALFMIFALGSVWFSRKRLATVFLWWSVAVLVVRKLGLPFPLDFDTFFTLFAFVYLTIAMQSEYLDSTTTPSSIN